MCPEALTNIVDRDGDADEGADGDEELAEGVDEPVQPVLHGAADEAEAQRHQHGVGQPEGV